MSDLKFQIGMTLILFSFMLDVVGLCMSSNEYFFIPFLISFFLIYLSGKLK